MNKIVEILQSLQDRNVSDVFLSENKIPFIRESKDLKSLGCDKLSREDFKDFIDNYLNPSWQEFVENKDLDTSLCLSSLERFRVNLAFEQGLVMMTARKVPLAKLSFETLNIPSILKKFAVFNSGLLLFTGTTSSGKSSTMNALISYINNNFQKNIIMIEDPIEYVHKNNKSYISQREIGIDTLSFSVALRAVLRQNPDIILIGELRDYETVMTAINAALTGHLVVASLHTINTEQVLERLLSYVPGNMQEHFSHDLALSLRAIIAQKLLPRKQNSSLIPAFEILINTPLMSKYINKLATDKISELVRDSKEEGMISFNRYLLNMVHLEQITVDTALRYSENEEAMKSLLEGIKVGVASINKDIVIANNGSSIKDLLKTALYFEASDMLLSTGSPPVLRVNGVLKAMDLPPLSSKDSKGLLFGVLTKSQRKTFEEEREIDFALSITLTDDYDNEGTYRFRVNGFYQKGNVSCSLRLIKQEIASYEDLMLPNVLQQLINKRQGLLLTTGPTGSGKSTTITSLIDLINQQRECHIIMIEDPIEYVHANKKSIIEQREVYHDTLSYANAMKYVLRQDPDVIVIGEMRDQETIATAITAAETGHLVLATLHTNDAVQTIDRIIDSFQPHQQQQIRTQLASCLIGSISQRLLPHASMHKRVPAFEVLIANTGIRALIRDGKNHQIEALMETNLKEGMVTMDRQLIELYQQGLISYDTVQNNCKNRSILDRLG